MERQHRTDIGFKHSIARSNVNFTERKISNDRNSLTREAFANCEPASCPIDAFEWAVLCRGIYRVALLYIDNESVNRHRLQSRLHPSDSRIGAFEYAVRGCCGV